MKASSLAVLGSLLGLLACGGEPRTSAASGGERASVEAGPSYALDFLDLAAEQPERWEGRLVERDGQGRFRTWGWRVLGPGELPRLAYPVAEQPVDDRYAAWVEVRQRGKDWFARAPVSATRGDRAEPVELSLVQYAGFGGRLVDEEGAPVVGAQLTLVQERAGEAPLLYDGPRSTWSGADGIFRFPLSLEPGGYHLRVRSEGRAEVQLDLELEGGEVEGYELRLAGAAAGEELAVALVGEDGPPQAVVALHSLDGQGVRRALHTEQSSTEHGFVELVGSGCAMLFAALPPGRYEASIFGLDGRRYEPSTVELELPFDAEGLVFVAVGAAPRELRFELAGAGQQAPPAAARVRITGLGWWFPEAGALAWGEALGRLAQGGGARDWTVFAPGHRPAHGRIDELRAADEQRWEPLGVELEPGWGCELLFRDGDPGLPPPSLDSLSLAAFVRGAPPVAGVEVWIDGERAAVSDAAGRVRLARESMPRELEFRKAGWRAFDARAAGGEGGGEAAVLDQVGGAVLWFGRAEGRR